MRSALRAGVAVNNAARLDMPSVRGSQLRKIKPERAVKGEDEIQFIGGCYGTK
jgi:hypothetical protein